MKVIKLELQEIPESFNRQVYIRAVYPKISPVILSELDTINYMDTSSVTQELYPLNQDFS